MPIIELSTVVKFIAEFGVRIVSGKIKRQEAFIKIVKKVGLSSDELPRDFDSIYVYALIQYGLGKPKPVLDFFRHKIIKDAFRKLFEEDKYDKFNNEAEDFLEWSKAGKELQKMDYDPRSEIENFKIIFLDLVNQAQDVVEIKQNKKLEEIKIQLRELITIVGSSKIKHHPSPKDYKRQTRIRTPYGYKRVSNQQGYTFEIEEEQASVLIKIKRMYLEGVHVKDIITSLENDNIVYSPPTKWAVTIIKKLLSNKFYAGVEIDYMPRMKQHAESHLPLWSKKDYELIVHHMSFRHKKGLQEKHINQLSDLVYCGVCGDESLLNATVKNGRDKSNSIIWNCRISSRHVSISHDILLAKTSEGLSSFFREDATPIGDVDNHQISLQVKLFNKQLSSLGLEEIRLKHLLQQGSTSPHDYNISIDRLNSKKAQIQAQINTLNTQLNIRKTGLEKFEIIKDLIPLLPLWLEQDNPISVNAHLRRVIQKIIVAPDKFEIHFR